MKEQGDFENANALSRVYFGLGVLPISILSLLGLGIITVGSQTLRAAVSNPVDAIKMQ